MQWSASGDASASVRSDAPTADHVLFQPHSFVRPALAARAYATTQAVAAPLLPVTVATHAEATRLLDRAHEQLQAGQRSAGRDTLQRAAAHIDMMRRCVLPEKGEMARDLLRIYEYLLKGLKQAIASDDGGDRVEIARLTLQALTTAWETRAGGSGPRSAAT